jgi:hypothetical protein
MLEIRKITARIKRAANIGLKIDAITVEGSEALAELVREQAVADVLSELMESLNGGESLEDAIQTIHANF